MAASTPLNNDVVTELLLHLSVQSLLRFRSVCKFWRHLIDSPSFRRLHVNNNNNNNNNKDDMVYLQFTFPFPFPDDRDPKLSVKLLDNGKSLKSYYGLFHYFSHHFKFAGRVKGLICIVNRRIKLPSIAICNPFLGQFKHLPISPSFLSPSCRIVEHEVGIGFDEDYKVVVLLDCLEHRHIHAQLYSRATDSWRDLGGGVLDQALHIIKPIKSLCENGYFAHWLTHRHDYDYDYDYDYEVIILTFDMKNEVFRAISTRPSDRYLSRIGQFEILAKDECSILLFVLSLGTNSVKMYESRCEGSILSWNLEMKVDLEQPFRGITLWRSDCVVLNNYGMGNEDLMVKTGL